ncbi:hypothetical protein QQS21_005358 [Conoideocrella luteorostrata]|uniref:ATP-grasp domain-containing protein n=1 Tax=Conoideocrella luteorostrata TaxID=1105319 RepID=A0AAJ0CPJ5_9HYPO|nr:hypothetical protein QQS21_005358 [Conoideocrella luteorostrata]
MNAALVVLDMLRHAVTRDEYAHLLEEFAPVDMTPDKTLIQRLTNTLSQMQHKGQHLDGIVSVDEHLLEVIARAATLLNLPAHPLAQSPWPRISSKSPSTRDQPGYNHFHGHEELIEKYVNGPEVDANMALVNGQVAFFEANDDFPSSADYVHADDTAARPAPFVETSSMVPSALPAGERKTLQQRLHKIALAVGFRDGVLHTGAKRSNSSSRLVQVKGAESEDIVDLDPKPEVTSAKNRDDIILIEINPRAPGWQEVEATAQAYGLSYYSSAIANAIDDREQLLHYIYRL